MSQPILDYSGNSSAHDPSKSFNGMAGTCLCGAISVTINDHNLFTQRRGHLCHCENCHKSSGSDVSSSLAIEKDKVQIRDSKGSMRTYEDCATGSGKCVRRSFCGTCACPILSAPEVFPGVYVLKMGVFPRMPAPEAESFAEHRHALQGVHDGVVQFATKKGGKKLGE